MGFSSSGGCQASGTSSAMSTNSKSRIFFTSFGGSAVEKPWLVEIVGEALVLVIGVVEVGSSAGVVRVEDGTVSGELLEEVPMGKIGTWAKDAVGMPNERPVWKSSRE